MASINSLSGGSSTSSIYGNANIISGLASGMDTEAMIENAVSGIQKKIANLQQDRTMMEWEQEAFRSIIDKMVNFTNKYTSFSSGTNLLSEAFFRDSLSVSTSGKYADKITASGRSSSNVQILGVKQLASAATYKVSGVGNTNAGTIMGIDSFDFNAQKTVGTLNGSLTLRFGTASATIRFGEDDVYNSAEELAEGIRKKLEGTDLEGKVSAVADEENGFKFVIDSKQLDYGNNLLTIASVSGNLEDKLGITADSKANVHDVKQEVKVNSLTDNTKTNLDMLKGKSISFTLDGVNKQISFADEEIAKLKTFSEENKDDVALQEKMQSMLKDMLEDKLNKAFGEGQITVDSVAAMDSNGAITGFQLSFAVKENSASTLRIEGGDLIGLKSKSETSYTNTSMKLDAIVGNFAGLTTSDDPNTPEKDEKYVLKMNDNVVIGYFDKDSTLDDVIKAINSNTESPVTVSFSKLSNSFVFTAKETGSVSEIDFGSEDNSLAARLFGVVNKENKRTYTEGKDAIFSMSVDGVDFNGVTRSSNSFEIDGMTVNFKETFAEEKFDGSDATGFKMSDEKLEAAKSDAVSFTSKTDSDKIIEAIKSMVKDYNEMANEIKDAYSTMPLYNSKGQRYEPLTEEDEKDMSDSAVDRYNEKAKTGILFGDSNLSSLYNDIRSAINELGMTNIGITTEYKDGKTTLVVDEAKLKETLEKDPEKVTSVFTQSKENGAKTDGFMEKLKDTMDLYAKTTGTKGILIDLVGSPKSALSLLNNTYKSKIDKMDETIASWQDKLADKIDYYNRQFTRLEQLISEMNSQSSSLMGLMGY